MKEREGWRGDQWVDKTVPATVDRAELTEASAWWLNVAEIGSKRDDDPRNRGKMNLA
jgi:hypothetical protein